MLPVAVPISATSCSAGLSVVVENRVSMVGCLGEQTSLANFELYWLLRYIFVHR